MEGQVDVLSQFSTFCKDRRPPEQSHATKNVGNLSVFDSSGAPKKRIFELLTARNVYELHSTQTPAVCLSAVSLRKFRMKFKDNTQPFDDSFLLQFLLAEPPYPHKQSPRALLSAKAEMPDRTWFPAQVPPVLFSTRSPSPPASPRNMPRVFFQSQPEVPFEIRQSTVVCSSFLICRKDIPSPRPVAKRGGNQRSPPPPLIPQQTVDVCAISVAYSITMARFRCDPEVSWMAPCEVQSVSHVTLIRCEVSSRELYGPQWRWLLI